MTRSLYLECSAGISGDMTVAALLDAGASEEKLRSVLDTLPVQGFSIEISCVQKAGQDACDFNVVLEVDNIATIKDLVRRNYGVSILARSACLDELKKGKLTALPIENLSMVREVNLLYHHTFNHMEILQDIVRIYNEAAKKAN